ncbi:RagB/SusD family nutrient uptake outer membrane protein [Flavobacterium capsici]|uniref:RagB/SusD family nutrient uptake outer membrane protein n=1 Tax=Flavobacterium capsici TaxID=3075618 RepID=A0AA96F3M5_9FLAO|nr:MULTISPECIES: RagB/SusD family nutrient uptake outer membrane protein [unclassified Flavobacterium]WNM18075.1 RagB/SusD family nutrient uptake outer membrane protein [Flavobacterium sp. PMR2A8]WNM22127.1 RagB/SusD family nutrient uptake outer membrane protein [Flavobacterium sp. PMTSA4]
MKKEVKIFLYAAIVIFITSCSSDFMDVKPEGMTTEDNYYKDEAQAKAALTSVYDLLRKNSGGFENMITMFNAASDDHVAGGGGESDGAGIQSFSNYTINPYTIPVSFWSDYYKGIYRANVLLSKLPGVPMDENVKVRFTAEAKTLRAYYYFNLVRMFKNVPLITQPLSASEFYNVPQALPEDVYAQIEQDLLESIDNLPTTVTIETDGGRLTRGAAKAILGKVYLYEGKNTLAAEQFLDVNGTPGQTSQYGYHLLSSFADLWSFTNKFNTESILEVSHSAQGSYWGIWGSSSDEGNTVNVMVGPRSYNKLDNQAPELPSGWSFNVFTQNFYDFMQGDPRFNATVFDLKTLNQDGHASYIAGYQDTGYFLNKFLPKQADVYDGSLGGDAVLNYAQNTYAIRLADTYLMEAEALGGTGGRAQALLDAVRARVGLSSVPVSMSAIKDERRRELAGEGHRWFDLVRWGDAPAKLGNRGFVAGKNEILPIPIAETNNTLIQQNPIY